MSDFSRVHGPGHDPKSLFARENAVLRDRIQQLEQEMLRRAAPTLSNLIDALNNLAAGAGQGDSAAKAVLGQFFKTLDGAREASSVLTVVKNGS